MLLRRDRDDRRIGRLLAEELVDRAEPPGARGVRAGLRSRDRVDDRRQRGGVALADDTDVHLPDMTRPDHGDTKLLDAHVATSWLVHSPSRTSA